MSRARSLHASNSIVMQGNIRQRKGIDTACSWHWSASAKGGMISAFSKTRGGRKGKKNKKSFTGCLLQDVKEHVRTSAGQQLNISQANGMGPILEPCAPTLKPA